jgi:hypothetical protein
VDILDDGLWLASGSELLTASYFKTIKFREIRFKAGIAMIPSFLFVVLRLRQQYSVTQCLN